MPFRQIAFAGKSPDRIPFAPPWTMGPHTKSSPQRCKPESLEKTEKRSSRLSHLNYQHEGVIGNVRFMLNWLLGIHSTESSVHITMDNVTMRCVIDCNPNRGKITNHVGKFRSFLPITERFRIVIDLLPGGRGGRGGRRNSELTNNGDMIFDFINTATVPLGMFGVTEPLPKILTCFDYLDFLHS